MLWISKNCAKKWSSTIVGAYYFESIEDAMAKLYDLRFNRYGETRFRRDFSGVMGQEGIKVIVLILDNYEEWKELKGL